MKKITKKLACALAMVATMSLTLPFSSCSTGGFGYKFNDDLSHVPQQLPDGTKTCGLTLEVTIVPDWKIMYDLGLYDSIPVSVTVPAYYKKQKVIYFMLKYNQPVKKLILPKTVEQVQLQKTMGDMQIVVAEDNPYYEVIDGDLYKKETGELIYDYIG